MTNQVAHRQSKSMRVFQNSSIYPGYRPEADRLVNSERSFAAAKRSFIADLYGGCHLLEPVLEDQENAFFTNGDQPALQNLWAKEQGMPSGSRMDDILRAQIEHHKTEVFYNLDPITFPGSFAKTLPSCVKIKIAWRAAPSGKIDFTGYDLMVCNFPSILRSFEKSSLRAAYFSPSTDPRIQDLASNRNRSIDIAFIGSFSRHHSLRTAVLDTIAVLSLEHKVALHLEVSKATRWAESFVLAPWVPSRYKRSPAIRRVARPPVFGRKFYEVLSDAKIVVNGAIDMSGKERGNIRCFETLAAGALMLSDEGIYPEGMVDAKTFLAYNSLETLRSNAQRALTNPGYRHELASAGTAMLAQKYSKPVQWENFQNLAGAF